MTPTDLTDQPPLPKEEFVIKSASGIFVVWALAVLFAMFPGFIVLYFWGSNWAAVICLPLIAWAAWDTKRLAGRRIAMGPARFEVLQRGKSLGVVAWDEIARVRERGLWLVVETKRHTEVWVPQAVGGEYPEAWLRDLLRPFQTPRRYFWTAWSIRVQVAVGAACVIVGVGLIQGAAPRGLPAYATDEMSIYYLRVFALTIDGLLAVCGMLGLSALGMAWDEKRVKRKNVTESPILAARNEFWRFLKTANPSLDPIEMDPGRGYGYCSPGHIVRRGKDLLSVLPMLLLAGALCTLAFVLAGGTWAALFCVSLVALMLVRSIPYTRRGRLLKLVANDEFKVTVTELWVLRKNQRLIFPLASRTEPSPNKRSSAPLSWYEQFTNDAGEVYHLDRRLIVSLEGDDG